MTGAVIAAGAAAAGPRITIVNRNVATSRTTPTHATASYSIASSGDINIVNQAGASDDGDWITPKFGMSNYECRMDTNSGSLTSGTTGAWLNCGTTRTWSNVTAGTASLAYNGTLSIRYASTGVVLKTATIVINADESP